MLLKDVLNEQTKRAIETYTVQPEKLSHEICASPVEKTVYYPTIHLDSEVLPELKDWNVDHEYVVVFRMRQKSKSMHTKGKKECYEGSFEIREVAVLKESTPEKKDKPKSNNLKKLYNV